MILNYKNSIIPTPMLRPIEKEIYTVSYCTFAYPHLVNEKLQAGADDIRSRKKTPNTLYFVINEQEFVSVKWQIMEGRESITPYFKYSAEYSCNGKLIAGIYYTTKNICPRDLILKVSIA